MHYRNGRPAANGDQVVAIGHDGKILAVGVLYGAVPDGDDFYNGHIAPVQPVTLQATLYECLHVDDVAELLAEKGLDKPPPGRKVGAPLILLEGPELEPLTEE